MWFWLNSLIESNALIKAITQLKPFTARIDLKAVTGIDGDQWWCLIFNCKTFRFHGKLFNSSSHVVNVLEYEWISDESRSFEVNFINDHILMAHLFCVCLVFSPVLLFFPNYFGYFTHPPSDGVESWSKMLWKSESRSKTKLSIYICVSFSSVIVSFFIIILYCILGVFNLKFNIQTTLISWFQSARHRPLCSPSATLKVWSLRRRGVEFQPGRWKRT